MIGIPLIEIPVYRIAEKKWAVQKEKEWKRLLHYWCDPCDAQGIPITEEVLNTWRSSFEREYPRWHYNEVIGWLSLHLVANDIVGNLWLAKGRKFSRRTKKSFLYYGDLFKVSLFQQTDSNAIFDELKSSLVSASKRSPLRKRKLFLDGFLRIGPLVNWVALKREHL